MFESLAVGAMITISAGVAATGGAIATYYNHHTGPGPAYALVIRAHPDPYHSDPGGEWIRIQGAEYGGTAATMYLITGPGD
jgi:hypothetical protein